ncbi:hypothetical protein [Glycomyces albidus]|jgi:hypothetical protein|uniref:hypothetical protein n=1 Tax=Glycomyces albidus TaxID=2656774 RepID=UPI001290475D|nr:hypothetical protein [Glycomyces albidus]
MSSEFDREHETVAAAFQRLKAESSAQFPPPPVDELIMRGPAALRRRRLVSLAAVVGACTAVTAGGFAVAQTLGPLKDEPEAAETSTGSVSSAESDEHPTGSPGNPSSDEGDDGGATTFTPSPPADDIDALLIAGPFEGDWAQDCAPGLQDADFESWQITGDTGWSIAFAAEGDADGDGENDTVLALTCGEQTGVAAFSAAEDEAGEPVLASFGWVWQPDGAHAPTAVTAVDAGAVTLEGVDSATGEVWTVTYAWDPEQAVFTLVDDGATSEPTADPSESTSTPAETPSSDGTTAGTSGADGS